GRLAQPERRQEEALEARQLAPAELGDRLVVGPGLPREEHEVDVGSEAVLDLAAGRSRDCHWRDECSTRSFAATLTRSPRRCNPSWSATGTCHGRCEPCQERSRERFCNSPLDRL